MPSGSQRWTLIILGEKTCGWNLWYPSLKQRMFYMHCTEASTRFLYKVNIFSSPKKCSLSILSGGTDILRWRTRTASMSFWLLSDCQDWGQGGVYYNRLHNEHVSWARAFITCQPLMRVRKKLMRGEKNLARGRGGGLFEGRSEEKNELKSWRLMFQWRVLLLSKKTQLSLHKLFV